MAMSWGFLTMLSTITLIVAVFFSDTSLSTFHYMMGSVEHAPKERWAGFGSFNNEECWANPVGQGCEDVKSHGSSHTMFLACGSPRDRVQFYPPAARFNTRPGNSYKEYFVKYEIESNKTTILSIENWDDGADLILHGLDIFSIEKDDSKILIYAVNHGREGESVLLFSHALGTDTLRLIEKFVHPLIKTPNGIAAAGPSSFFISNDRYSYAGKLRHFESVWGPFKWASNIAYCEKSKGLLQCRIVTPAMSHAWANGVLLVNQGRSLLVNDIVYGTTTVYDVHPRTKALRHAQTIVIGGAPDNISPIANSEDVTVSVLPSMHNVGNRTFGDGPINYDAHVEGAVVRLVKDRGYEPELLYWDNGSQISILTGSAYVPSRQRLVVSGVFERHFLVCEI